MDDEELNGGGNEGGDAPLIGAQREPAALASADQNDANAATLSRWSEPTRRQAASGPRAMAATPAVTRTSRSGE